MCLHFAPDATRFVSCDFVIFKPHRFILIVEPQSVDMMPKDSCNKSVQQLIDDRMCGVCIHCL